MWTETRAQVMGMWTETSAQIMGMWTETFAQVMGMDLRATPVRTFISRLVLSLLSLFIPEVK